MITSSLQVITPRLGNLPRSPCALHTFRYEGWEPKKSQRNSEGQEVTLGWSNLERSLKGGSGHLEGQMHVPEGQLLEASKPESWSLPHGIASFQSPLNSRRGGLWRRGWSPALKVNSHSHPPSCIRVAGVLQECLLWLESAYLARQPLQLVPTPTLPLRPVVQLSLTRCLLTALLEKPLSHGERESSWCQNSGHVETWLIRGHTITRWVRSTTAIDASARWHLSAHNHPTKEVEMEVQWFPFHR